MSRATTVEDLVQGWGPDNRMGILIDHLEQAKALGAVVHRGSRGAKWVTYGKAPAVPVVCGDLIRIWTEDGPMDGRCGSPVVGDRGACERHADERDEYMRYSEAERLYQERQQEA